MKCQKIQILPKKLPKKLKNCVKNFQLKPEDKDVEYLKNDPEKRYGLIMLTTLGLMIIAIIAYNTVIVNLIK